MHQPYKYGIFKKLYGNKIDKITAHLRWAVVEKIGIEPISGLTIGLQTQF